MPPKMPTVLLTRSEHQVEPMKTQLESQGFRVLLQPVIEILPPESWQPMDEVLHKLRQNEFDWLLFSSRNGVHAFFDRLAFHEGTPPPRETTNGVIPSMPLCDTDSLCDTRYISRIKIAVVGSGTDGALYQRSGRYADVVPETFTAEYVAEMLLPEAKQGKRFLHLRANRGRDVLQRLLTESGGCVTEIAVYQSVDRTEADPLIVKLLQQGGIDFITVTSSATARSLVAMFGGLLRHTLLVSISPITSRTLCELGFPPAQEAEEASLAGMVNALARVASR